MDLEVGEEFVLDIEGVSSTGEGVGSYGGYALFVEGALPQERVRVQLIERKRRYGRAVLLEILVNSPQRVEPICPLFGRCGGCQLMHLSYEGQLKVKRARVLDALERIGKFSAVAVDACLPSPKELHYRNKIQLPVRADGRLVSDCKSPRSDLPADFTARQGAEREGNLNESWRARAHCPATKDAAKMNADFCNQTLGLYARGTHDIVPIEQCWIHTELGERAHLAVAELLKEFSLPSGALRHVLIKSAVHTGHVLVALITREEVNLAPLARALLRKVPEVKAVLQCVNRRKDNVILGAPFRTLAGFDQIQERINGLLINVSAASFFQVNPLQAERLYAKALKLTSLSGKERVLDAFCGVGTLSLQLAAHALEVIGIECVPQAVEDARLNAKQNGIDNATFYCGLAENLIRKVGKIDVAVLNPPRKGCAPSFLKELLFLAPEKIVMISCDPATLARDLKEMCAQGYALASVTPFDMFPQTAHVETLVLLHKEKA